jgi:hypothetical protein
MKFKQLLKECREIFETIRQILVEQIRPILRICHREERWFSGIE